jgi:hypothetical protein
MSQKDVFINQATIVASALAQSFDNALALANVYFDRGYNGGGANELTTNDLEAAGLTPAQIASGITLFQQLQLLRSGAQEAGHSTVVPADYDATLNTLRRDI